MSILIGICLSAASGFRIFVPFLVLSMASFIGGIDFGVSASWLNSVNILIGLGFASVLEITGYYNPWMDNMLDLISTPLSFFAGTTIILTVLPDSNPILKWIIALICGGVTALNIRLLSLKARALSSYFTTGIGNSVVTTIETISSFVVSILALYLPLAAVIFTVSVVLFFLKMIRSFNTKPEN
ncbi:MAG: DUF4126 domain-containing protein [bacterium]